MSRPRSIAISGRTRSTTSPARTTRSSNASTRTSTSTSTSSTLSGTTTNLTLSDDDDDDEEDEPLNIMNQAAWGTPEHNRFLEHQYGWEPDTVAAVYQNNAELTRQAAGAIVLALTLGLAAALPAEYFEAPPPYQAPSAGPASRAASRTASAASRNSSLQPEPAEWFGGRTLRSRAVPASRAHDGAPARLQRAGSSATRGSARSTGSRQSGQVGAGSAASGRRAGGIVRRGARRAVGGEAEWLRRRLSFAQASLGSGERGQGRARRVSARRRGS